VSEPTAPPPPDLDDAIDCRHHRLDWCMVGRREARMTAVTGRNQDGLMATKKASGVTDQHQQCRKRPSPECGTSTAMAPA